MIKKGVRINDRTKQYLGSIYMNTIFHSPPYCSISVIHHNSKVVKGKREKN
jgi:hypothetical protein